MELDYLIICTLNLLQVLLDKYNAHELDSSILKSHSELKIRFLKENIETIKNSQYKEDSEKILDEYKTLLLTH